MTKLVRSWTTASRHLVHLGAVAACAAAAAPRAHAQAVPGVIRGTVTQDGSGAPLGEVQVLIVGTRRGALTAANGRFLLTGVPAGSVTLRAQRIGYAPAQREVTLRGGDTAVVDLRLGTSAISLDEVVVTGTPGATEKRVLGNVVSTVKAADITQVVPEPNVGELLQGRTAGINVMTQGGGVGTATNIRIRGTSSLSANYNPVVYIDGIRMNAGVQQSYDNSGATVQATSALDAIDPNDIESIEVIKGPAAATLYGADAASGVIQIITKKGKMGQQSVQWTARAEDGTIDWALPRPKTYWLCQGSQLTDSTNYPACAKLGLTSSAPADQRMLVNDPLNQPGALRTGSTESYGISARGGAEHYSFFFSGDHEGDNGVLHNNFFKRNNGRVNFQVDLLRNLDVTVNAAYARTDAQEPLSDNSSNSVLRNAYRDRPSGPWPWQFQFRGLGPLQSNQYDNESFTERYILGTTLNYRPFSWFTNRLVLGMDANDQRHSLFYGIDTTGRAPFGITNAGGFLGYILPTTHNWTVDYAGTVNHVLTPQLTSATSVGVQYNNYTLDSWTAEGIGLVANQLNTVGAAAARNSDQNFLSQASLGTYVQEQLGWRERVYATAAVRVDNNSAFGSDFKWVTYPKVSLAYVISDEPFFRVPHVNQLKLRGAWGEAGNSPPPFSAVRAYGTNVTTMGDQSVNQLQLQTYGNPNLHAETGSEVELGFDASLLSGRLGAEFTYYDKVTRDALVSVPAPPSTGFVAAGGGSGTYLANLGEIGNSGIELTLNATPVERDHVSWTSTLALSTNHNRLVTFGAGFKNVVYGDFANVQENAAGYPIGGFWGTDVKRDAGGKPVLDASGHVQVNPKMFYIGPSTPTREISFSNTVTLLRNIRLYGYLDYKGGYYMWDAIKYVNDRLDKNTWAVNNPNADPLQVQILQSGATSPDIQRADFVKLRELSIAYSLPVAIAHRFGGSSATVSFAGRNLRLWKLDGYPGVDPEVNFDNQTEGGLANFIRADYGAIPMTRRYVGTVTLNF